MLGPKFVPILQGVLITGVLLTVFIAILIYLRKVPSYLARWAQAYGFEILRFRHRSFFTGPYNRLFTTKYDRLQNIIVYLVTIRDREGRERNCWVLCSSGFMDPNNSFCSRTEVVETKWI